MTTPTTETPQPITLRTEFCWQKEEPRHFNAVLGWVTETELIALNRIITGCGPTAENTGLHGI